MADSFLTTDDIIAWIRNNKPEQTEEAINEFARALNEQMLRLDYRVSSGGKVIAYAGKLDENNKLSAIYQTVDNITQNSNGEYCFINNSADNILNDGKFKTTLKDAVMKNEYYNNIVFGEWNGDTRSKYGIGDNLSLNDLVSENFMANNAYGDVKMIITETANSNSVLYSTELPKLLQMNNVTSINGIPKAELAGLDISECFEVLKNKSLMELNEATIYRNAAGVEILSFNNTNMDFNTDISSGFETAGTYGSRLNLMSDAELTAKYKLLEGCGDIETFNVLRNIEYQMAKGKNISSILVEDTLKGFKNNNSLLFKDIKDLHVEDFLEFAKHEYGIYGADDAAKALYKQSSKLKLTKAMRSAGNVASTALELYLLVDFISDMVDGLENGTLTPKDVGRESAAYISSASMGWLTSSAATAFFSAALPLVGVTGPLGVVAVLVFALGAGIAGSQFGDWLARTIYDPAYDTTWGLTDMIASGINGFHLVEGTDDPNIMDFSDGRITSGIISYDVNYYISAEGNGGDDYIHGYVYDDVLSGGDGNDEIYGGTGNDELHGGNGIDTIHGGYGDDIIYGDAEIDLIYGENGNDKLYGGDGGDLIYAGNGNDEIYGGSGGDEIYAEYGNNKVYGGEGDDLIICGTGDDIVNGENGDDVISIEYGNNTVRGGMGNDVVIIGDGDDVIQDDGGNDYYLYYSAIGNDTINDSNGSNSVVFYSNIVLDNMYTTFSDDYNIVLHIDGSDDTIEFVNFRRDSVYRNYTFSLSDITDFKANSFSPFKRIHGDDNNNVINVLYNNDSNTIWGHGGNDNLVGGNYADFLYGGDGNDYLDGGYGNDYLDGGYGNDTLYGGYGNDTYVYGRGYGNDIIWSDGDGINKIKFVGLSPEDMTVHYASAYSAILTVTETGETLTIENFRKSSVYRNFTLEFDGEEMTLDDIRSPFLNVLATEASEEVYALYPNSVVRALGGNDVVNTSSGNDTVYGGDGNDTIYANSGNDYVESGNGNDYINGADGNDYLDGGYGNDTLYGGYGNDTYVYGKGYGNDVIQSDNNGVNKIKFVGLSPEDMTINYPGDTNNAILTVTETGETLTLREFRYSSSYRNFTLEFDDGRTGVIDYSTATFILNDIETSSEEGDESIVQSNAELLTAVCSQTYDSTELYVESDNTIISNVPDNISATNETDKISDRTDIQVMLLAESMSVFNVEDNISDSINIIDVNDNIYVTNQLLMHT